MAKTFFNLPGYYEGLRSRRIAHSGRLWLVKIISDPDKESELEYARIAREKGIPRLRGRKGDCWKPYWFVFIRNFDLRKDHASGAKSIGVWRFQREADARSKFAALLPLYPKPAPKPLSPAQQKARALFIEMAKSSMKSPEV